jgi:molybdate transport system substrate-binding protein
LRALLASLAFSAFACLAQAAGASGDPVADGASLPRSATELKVFSVQPLKPLLEAMAPAFERATGRRLVFTFDVSAALKRQIDAGAPFDVAFILPAIIDGYAKTGQVAAGTRADVARAAIGVAVRAGAPKPDISSADALKRALIGAKSIAFSSEGASGLYFKSLLERLGIAADVAGQLRPLTSSAVVPALAQGDVALAVISPPAILADPGVDLVGVLPAELQNYVVYTAGVGSASQDAAGARALIRTLMAPATLPLLKAKGLEPAAP